MINGNAVNIRQGKKKADGSVVYADLEKYMATLLFAPDDVVNSFTLAADANSADMATFPSGVAFIDGNGNGGTDKDTYESINGGVVCNPAPGLTAQALLPNGNITYILDTKGNEVLAGNATDAVALKRVYGFLSTTNTDGIAIDNLKIEFAIKDDTAPTGWVAYTLPAGDYTYQVNRAYNISTAATAGRLGGVLSKDVMEQESYDELSEVLVNPGSSTFKLDSEQVLQADRKITLKWDTGFTVADSAATALTGTATSSTDKKLATASATKSAFDTESITVTLNGVEVATNKVIVVDTKSIEVDLSDSIASTKLYKDSVIQATWVKNLK